MALWAPAAHAVGGILYGLVSDAFKKGGEVAIEKVFKQIEIEEQHRVAMWHFIANELRDREARKQLLNRHRRALANRRSNPLEEDKLSEFLTRTYVSITDPEARQVAFRSLGRSDNAGFEQARKFVEANKFLTWALLGRKYGMGLWENIRGAADAIGASPAIEQSLTDIREWIERGFPTHRASAQTWMRGKTREFARQNRRSTVRYRTRMRAKLPSSLTGLLLTMLTIGAAVLIWAVVH